MEQECIYIFKIKPMTNKDKILRYLECGLKVKATSKDKSITIYEKFIDKAGNDLFLILPENKTETVVSQSWLEGYTLTPIPLKPNYQTGDLVHILPIARELDDYDRWDEVVKAMVDSGVYTIKTWNGWNYLVYTKDKSEYWYFPSWALAPAFPDEIDEKTRKRQELEAKMEEIQKEIDALKN